MDVAGFVTGKSKKTRERQAEIAQMSHADKAATFALQAEQLANGAAGDLANVTIAKRSRNS